MPPVKPNSEPTKPAPVRPPVMVHTQIVCKHCKKTERSTLSYSGIQARRKGVTVEKAFPDLSKEQHIQLMHNVCPDCQKSDHYAVSSGSGLPSIKISKKAGVEHIVSAVSLHLLKHSRYLTRTIFLSSTSASATRGDVLTLARKYTAVTEV